MRKFFIFFSLALSIGFPQHQAFAGGNLLEVVQKGNVEEVRKFIEGGWLSNVWAVDLETPTFAGYTPLGVALRAGHLDIAKLLIEKGAKVNFGHNEGSALTLLVSQVHSSLEKTIELIRLIVARGVNINEPNRSGDTPLLVAAKNPKTQPEVIQALIQAGADKSLNGETVLRYLLANWAGSKVSLAKALPILSQFQLNEETQVNSKVDDETPLNRAAASESGEWFSFLLKHGANPNEEFRGGTILSYLYMYMDHKPKYNFFIKEVLESGKIDFNHELSVAQKKEDAKFAEFVKKVAQEKNKPTPDLGLLDAMHAGPQETETYFQTKKFNPNIPVDYEGNTALDYVLKRPFQFSSVQGIVDILVKNGADVKHRLPSNKLPIEVAIEKRSLELVEALINRGADVNFRNENGETPLIILLKSAEKYIDKAEREREDKDQLPSLIKMFKREGADINASNLQGDTALIYAVRNNLARTTQALLLAGADVNQANLEGNTPLIEAVNHVVNPNYYGVEKRILPDNKIFETLLKFQPKINQSNKKGETALYWAVVNGSPQAAQVLIENGAWASTSSSSDTSVLSWLVSSRGSNPYYSDAKNASVVGPLLKAMIQSGGISYKQEMALAKKTGYWAHQKFLEENEQDIRMNRRAAKAKLTNEKRLKETVKETFSSQSGSSASTSSPPVSSLDHSIQSTVPRTNVQPTSHTQFVDATRNLNEGRPSKSPLSHAGSGPSSGQVSGASHLAATSAPSLTTVNTIANMPASVSIPLQAHSHGKEEPNISVDQTILEEALLRDDHEAIRRLAVDLTGLDPLISADQDPVRISDREKTMKAIAGLVHALNLRPRLVPQAISSRSSVSHPAPIISVVTSSEAAASSSSSASTGK